MIKNAVNNNLKLKYAQKSLSEAAKVKVHAMQVMHNGKDPLFKDAVKDHIDKVQQIIEECRGVIGKCEQVKRQQKPKL